MANVYTKRSSLPRTVTQSDFGFKSRQYVATRPEKPVRVHSPTRRQNPQPPGLNFQSPYNRKMQSFGIWNINQELANIKRRNSFNHLNIMVSAIFYATPSNFWHQMAKSLLGMKHHTVAIGKTNFSCLHNPVLLAKRCTVTSQERNEFQENDTANESVFTDTVHRETFQWPKDLTKAHRATINFTRYGNSPQYPAIGIIPSAIASNRIPKLVDEKMTIDKLLNVDKLQEECSEHLPQINSPLELRHSGKTAIQCNTKKIHKFDQLV